MNDSTADPIERFFPPHPSFLYERIPVDLLCPNVETDTLLHLKLETKTAPEVFSANGEVEAEFEDGHLSLQIRTDTPVAVKPEGKPFLLIKPQKPGGSRPPSGAEIFTPVASEDGLQSEAITQAMRTLSSRGGGVLSVPPGVYPVSTIEMQSHVTLHLQKGAVLEATLDPDAYPVDPEGTLFEDLPNSLIPGPRRRVIYWYNCEYAALTGCGMITGQGSEYRRRTVGTPEGRPLINLMKFVKARQCRVEGVILADSEFWNTHVCLSQDIIFDSVAVINERPPREWAAYLGDHAKSWFWNNTDGINPDSSQRIVIRNCLLHTGDDCVAVKNTGTFRNELRDIEEIEVHHNLMICNTTPMKIGTETRGGTVASVHFHHNMIPFCSRMFAAELKDGITLKNLRVENITVADCNRPFDLEIIPRQDEIDQKLFSHVNGVTLRNIDIRRYRNEGQYWQSHIRGLDPAHTIKNVILSRIRLGAKDLNHLEDPDLVINEFTDGVELS